MKNFLSIPLTGNDGQGNPVGDKENVLVRASDILSVHKLLTEFGTGSSYDDYQIQITFSDGSNRVRIKHGADPQGASSNTMIEYIQNAVVVANQSNLGDTVHVLNPPFNIWSVS